MINSFTGDYYFLSNFYMAPVSYNGWDYTNNEAAFQAQKTKNRRLRFQLFSKASPSEAKATGRKIDLRWKTLNVLRGEGFAQGIFVEYGITIDDEAAGVRNGGFGSTTENK